MDFMNVIIRLCRICCSNLYPLKKKNGAYIWILVHLLTIHLVIIPESLQYGRQAYLPVDADLQIESPEELHTGYFELKDPDLASKEYGLVLEETKQNILEAQLKPKKYYDKKHSKPGKFKVNGLVLKLDFKWKKTQGRQIKG